MVQLREKNLDRDAFIALAKRLKAITAARGIPLIVNDSLEVALAAGADGLHIGQDDGDPSLARKSLGPRAILGVSVHSALEARAAERAGADYVGIGAVFPTGSKDGVSVLAPEAVRAIATSVAIPAVAIGGITAENAARLCGLGLAGVAAISAIFAEPDRVQEATARLAAAARSVAARSVVGTSPAEARA
jgi:thiamine-phosphate pyrophosphorylase